MTSYASVFERMCRVCLRHCAPDVAMTPLYDHDQLNNYGQAVLAFADVSITADDGLPGQICTKCLLLLKQAITFKLTSERTHQYLKQIQNKFAMSDFHASIVQYSMLTNYFPEEMLDDALNLNECCETKNDIKLTVLNEIDHKESIDQDDNLDISSDQNHSPEEAYSPETEWFYKKISNCLKTRQKQNLKMGKFISLKKPQKYHRKPKLKSIIKNKVEDMRKAKKFQEQLLNTKFQVAKKDERGQKVPNSLICNHCEKKYASKCSLRAHLLRHEAFQFICEHCGKGFRTRSELNSHCMSQHDMPRLYACSQCDFKAKRRPELAEHARAHTGERPYACETCGLTFRRKAVLRKHTVHHLDKKFKCERCPRSFYHRTDLQAHTNNVHERRYLYRCNAPTCQATYAKTSSVRKHLRNLHGVPRDQQGKILRISVQSTPTHLA